MNTINGVIGFFVGALIAVLLFMGYSHKITEHKNKIIDSLLYEEKVRLIESLVTPKPVPLPSIPDREPVRKYNPDHCDDFDYYMRDYQILLHMDSVWIFDKDRLVGRFTKTNWNNQYDSIFLKDNE